MGWSCWPDGRRTRLEDPRSCLRGSVTVRRATFAVRVENLVARVEALHADVVSLKFQQPASATATTQVGAVRRTLPTEGEPVDLAVLAEWVESFMVRYAAAGDWLKPCWWRHGFVVEELAALRVAWLAVYDAQASPSIRPRDSGGTTRPRSVGNEYGGRSAPVQAVPPCRTSPMIRSSAIPAGLRSPPPSTGNSKRRRSIVVRRAQDDRLRSVRFQG